MSSRLSLYCDARPAPILFGAADPFAANRQRLQRENTRAKTENTLVGRSFVWPVDETRQVTVQIVKATKTQVHVRPCFDLGEPAMGLQRGETITLSSTTALNLLQQAERRA